MTSRLTLFELNEMVSDAIGIDFPDAFWVEAELMEIRENRGHCYMEMVQKDVFSSALVAKASAKCWASKWKTISKKFIQATGGLPGVGMKLLINATVDFHPLYGFSLIVNDIDPAYTLGEMASKREEVIETLRAEGVFELQKELSLPLFAQRIAVISSATAAGYGDFCNQIEGNGYGLAFATTLFPAVMQGEQVEQSIISCLEEINRRSREFDCVVIIRGGGATSDMSSFDGLELARNVANFPLPIITGIGHERDECVLDLIAFHKAKTPTAVATFLIDNLLEVKARVELSQKTIKNAAVLYCTKQASKIETLDVRLTTAVKALLQDARHGIKLLSQRIEGCDPKLLLGRGYTMTMSGKRLVRHASELRQGQEIETIFMDGKVKSVVKQ